MADSSRAGTSRLSGSDEDGGSSSARHGQWTRATGEDPADDERRSVGVEGEWRGDAGGRWRWSWCLRAALAVLLLCRSGSWGEGGRRARRRRVEAGGKREGKGREGKGERGREGEGEIGGPFAYSREPIRFRRAQESLNQSVRRAIEQQPRTGPAAASASISRTASAYASMF